MTVSYPDAQLKKAEKFLSLHQRSGIFVIPNPWDAGSAKMLAQAGFEALATTSAGLAFSLGKPDGARVVTRSEALENAKAIVLASPLPVSADLENGYGDDPADCAETILLAAAAGLVGCSIEDATGIASNPIYPIELAVERIKSAVQAARSLPFPFILTARAENFLHGRQDLKDTLRRLEAFAEAGADVLYAPLLKKKDDILSVIHAVAPMPVNILAGIAGFPFTIAELEEFGVKRISMGSALSRVAYSAFLLAAEELRNSGTVNFLQGTMSLDEMNDRVRVQ